VIKGFATFHTKRSSTQTYVSSFWIMVFPRRGGGRNILPPRIHFTTRSEVPHGFAIFYTKRGSTQTYVSSFWIVEYTLYNAKRGSTWVSTFRRMVHLNTVQLLTATCSNWCVEIFYCSSAVNGSYLIELCSIECHLQLSTKRRNLSV